MGGGETSEFFGRRDKEQIGGSCLPGPHGYVPVLGYNFNVYTESLFLKAGREVARYLEHSGDVARSSSTVCQLNDTLSRRVRKRASIDEETTELVDPAVTYSIRPTITSRLQIRQSSIVDYDDLRTAISYDL